MVTISRVTSNGQVTIPAEIRKDKQIKPGDTMIWSVDDRGTIQVRPLRYSLADLDGILPVIPDADDDFGNVIRDATEEAVTRRLRRPGE